MVLRWLIPSGLTPRGLTPRRPIAAVVCRPVTLPREKLEVVALVLEAGIIPSHDHLQNALANPVRVLRQLRHPLGELPVRIRKVSQDRACIAGPAGDVVGRVVGVDDGKPVVVLVRESCNLVLQCQNAP
jgi:hypothetical protein